MTIGPLHIRLSIWLDKYFFQELYCKYVAHPRFKKDLFSKGYVSGVHSCGQSLYSGLYD